MNNILIIIPTYNESKNIIKILEQINILNLHLDILIDDNNIFLPPLYIDGDCLNILGANVKKSELYMLDGSRRLLANLLSKNDKTEIFLISKAII